MAKIEIRCPVGPKRLFAKLVEQGSEPVFTPDNLIEFACVDCRKAEERAGHRYARVLHRYNFLGELVETVTE